MLLKNLFKYWARLLFSPDRLLKGKYESFKSLLEHDKRAHERLAELEEVYYEQVPVDFKWVEKTYNDLADSVAGMVESLRGVCPTRYLDLEDYYRRIDGYARFMFRRKRNDAETWILPLPQAYQNADLAGGKAANLSAASQKLALPVPEGFVITTAAFEAVIRHNDLQSYIDDCLVQLDLRSPERLADVSERLSLRLLKASIPTEISDAVLAAARSLEHQGPLAVRSSAVSEDSEYSFAGQYKTILHVDPGDLVDAYREVLAGKYATSAMYYRIRCGLSDPETPMAALVIPMIDAAASGVMYTRDFSGGDSEEIVIHAVEGQGRPLVDGTVRPHVYALSPSSKSNTAAGLELENRDGSAGPLESETVAILAEWGRKLESFFGSAQDVEWCRDRSDNLFLLQSRPLRTAVSVQLSNKDCNFDDLNNTILLEGGQAASSGIAAGPVCRLKGNAEPSSVSEGAVLVARSALPSYVQILDRVAAVVTETGSTAGHLASVTREFDVPMIVNAAGALKKLEEGMEVTVHADAGRIYQGPVPSMLESPCARRNLLEDSPFMQRMGYVIRFVAPLELTDPQAENFKPSGCRSMHDIIRFAHEKAVAEMFHLNENRIRKIGGARKLEAGIPMVFYVLDVGGGFVDDLEDENQVGFEEIRSTPLRAVLEGLRHPDIRWGEFTHFDWASYDKAVMAGGIVKPESAMFASHAVVSKEYANLNLKFGYHFVIIDSVCDQALEDNYIMFRFSGGGADIAKRRLRADFLCEVLRRLDFEVQRKSDLVDARLQQVEKTEGTHRLDMLGRLLGATRLLDMYLKDESMVEGFVDDFMNGRYHFASVEDTSID